MQLTPELFAAIERRDASLPLGVEKLAARDGAVFVSTLEGSMKASMGDWIIKGVQGELYPCKPDIFEATYEAVSL
ncbi:MAG: hypothetical protein SFV32_12550 [Opitutaceae bacterium]|nr:hypothetical protein [Opitutaceae bacterium]